jgi:hypothetical protein
VFGHDVVHEGDSGGMTTKDVTQPELLSVRQAAQSASAAIQVGQKTSISNTDIVESMVGNPIGAAAGMQDVSQQLVDHSNVDFVLAADLGRALGAQPGSPPSTGKLVVLLGRASDGLALSGSIRTDTNQ